MRDVFIERDVAKRALEIELEAIERQLKNDNPNFKVIHLLIGMAMKHAIKVDSCNFEIENNS